MKRFLVLAFCVFITIFAGSCSDYTISHVDPTVIVQQDAPDGEVWVDSFLQPSLVNGVDILWVIDTSGSMLQHDERLLAGIEAMMNALPPAGWRLNIISASPPQVLNEQQFPLVPGDTVVQATTMYQNVTTGHFEAGLEAVMDYANNNAYANTWMRDDAALLVVFVSDEEDQSNVTVNTFNSWYMIQRPHVFLASIVNLPPAESLCNNNGYNNGDRYIEATNHFNGTVVDICSDDWSPGVIDASVQIQPHEFWDLSHSPIANTVRVFFDRVLIEVGWSYDAALNRVVFDTPPPPGVLVEIGYILDGTAGDDDDSSGE